MLLAIDVGNTNVTVGLFREETLCATWRIATGIERMPDEYGVLLLDMLRHEGFEASSVTKVSLCSVVPPLTATFEEMCRRYFKVEPLVVRIGVKTGLRVRMDNPTEVGTDRIVDAVAAQSLYGSPLIIVDLGTATTFDTISKDGDYIGGAIAPGLSTAAESLVSHTAMLPRVELTCPEHAIGTNTVAAMQSGLVFGYIGLIEGIIARIQKEIKGKAKVIATGGYASLIANETPVIDAVNPDLTLVGLRLIYMMNRT
jgi:type III pantothenate kinase